MATTLDDITHKEEEARFHNQRELDRQSLTLDQFERKHSNKKWYSITRQSRDFISRWLRTHCPNRVALDYCCGLGDITVEMTRCGAFAHGIDISAESVQTASRRLKEAGTAARSCVQVMDAECMSFEDNTFDVIVCSGVLHHLNLAKAYPELARVLKPTGRILCIEALGHNPAIALYRRLTPHLRTSWEADHILKMSHIRQAMRLFERVDTRFFHLFSIAAVPFRHSRCFSTILSLCESADGFALRIPGLNRMAWQVVFELSQPRKAATSC
jgi:ubiquinone/menaquinone biosynthesis C-methylase UbiE